MEEVITSPELAIAYLERLLEQRPGRILIGIVGKPGSGKSTLADFIVRGISCEASLLPMDGYHLSNEALRNLGRVDRKGAPDTFDARGFTSLLERVHNKTSEDIYFPIFHREFEESYAAEGVVKAETRLVAIDGNYLLLEDGNWGGIRPLLTESWFISVDENLRHKRLIERHMKFGKSEAQARDWALGSDENNAEIIAATRHLATQIIHLS